ncbi:E3 ubiquitin ligase RBR family [Trema orientale]|uniref:RBR-type E3 ubiquitin transferase n=1 Tax=Trema orientale TaxID=63057 RepID=A0A2P5AEY7_TREOI|nr:E3 ubiquitin ligase RBR family [Trema orientale]
MARTDEEYDLQVTLSEQRRELMAAKTLESDLDLAFHIQMQEAVTASLALRPSKSTLSPPPDAAGDDEDGSGLAPTLLLRDVERRCEAEMRKAREDLDRRIHDQKLASDITALPEDYWSKYGDWYEKPYGAAGSSSSSSSSSPASGHDSVRLYFKGLVSEEMVREAKVVVAGAGIAICDPKDNLLFHSRKNLGVLSGEAAELEALIEGLNKALALDLKRVTNRLAPRNSQIATLVNKVALLCTKFTYCCPSLLVSPNNIKFAYKSARDAIVSQITWTEETSDGKTKRETCIICFEDTDVAQMFSIDGCLHRYCFSCMKQHVEVTLHNGRLAKCPHDGCNSEVAIDSCVKFLPPNLVEVMGQRMKESAVPVAKKVYCPDPRCSALMSRDEVLEYTKTSFIGAEQSGARKCMKCQKFFCIDCRVPWHYNMTCSVYRRSNFYPHGDEQMLKSLASKRLWRQCAKCQNMVELLEGCYHITCRCFIFYYEV